MGERVRGIVVTERDRDRGNEGWKARRHNGVNKSGAPYRSSCVVESGRSCPGLVQPAACDVVHVQGAGLLCTCTKCWLHWCLRSEAKGIGTYLSRRPTHLESYKDMRGDTYIYELSRLKEYAIR